MTAPLRSFGRLLTTITGSCSRKIRYSDEFGARGAGQIISEKFGHPVFLYPCDICRGYHLTQRPQRNPSRDVAYAFRPAPR